MTRHELWLAEVDENSVEVPLGEPILVGVGDDNSMVGGIGCELGDVGLRAGDDLLADFVGDEAAFAADGAQDGRASGAGAQAG